MSALSCRRIRSSLIEEERKTTERQGIGFILRTSEKQGRPSLRRTFSADMSSKKWLTDQTLKKVPSSSEFSTYGNGTPEYSSSSSEEECEERRRRRDLEQPAQCDIWSSILAQKEKDSGSNPLDLPPYVPPLKKSSSSLSQKSLEICTESLGSETGSEGFSSDFDSYSSSEEEEEVLKEIVIPPVPKYNFSAPSSRRSCPPRSFPPPLPSISRPRIHMRPHRKDGRLVLEAVTLPNQTCLHAERQDGRLLLTLIKPLAEAETRETEDQGDEIRTVPSCEQSPTDQREIKSQERNKQLNQKEADGEALVVDKQYLVEVKLHRSVMNKLINGIQFRNPNPWSSEKKSKTDEKAEAGIRLAAAAAAPSPATTLLPSTAAFNTYECSWKRSTRQPSISHPDNNFLLSKKQLLLAKNQLPATFTVNTCKEPKRTLIIWDTYCVATT